MRPRRHQRCPQRVTAAALASRMRGNALRRHRIQPNPVRTSSPDPDRTTGDSRYCKGKTGHEVQRAPFLFQNHRNRESRPKNAHIACTEREMGQPT
jgi:hypothetical protein